MRLPKVAASAAVFAALALGVAACGSSGGGASTKVQGNTLTVYSSLPLQGPSRAQTAAIVNGIKLAMDEAGNKVGKFKVRYTSLDDSTAQAGTWTPEATKANARRASQDKSTIAYIGEFNPGASAVSIPILNEAGIAQIGPVDTEVGLTTKGPGAGAGEPESHYPAKKRTYVRLVPNDTIQGAALARLMKDEGCKKVAMANDSEPYGAGLAQNVDGSLKSQGLTITSSDAVDPNAPNYRSLASKAKGAGADCFVYSGVTASHAVQLFTDMAAALPNAKLFGSDRVAEEAFASPKKGGVPAKVAKNVLVTRPALGPSAYPPAGKRFFAAYAKTYGDANPDPDAIYGYEAAKLALDSVAKAGKADRQAVIDELHRVAGRASVLGTYSINKDGDTSLTDYGVYAIEGGKLRFDRTIKVTRPPPGTPAAG